MEIPPLLPPIGSSSHESDAARQVARQAQVRGDLQGAIQAYRHLLTLAPDDVDAHAQFAHVLERTHDLPAARRHAQTALDADPKANVARIALARVLIREGAYADAESVALVLAQRDDASANDRSVAWGLIGDARDFRDDVKGAFAAFTTANALALARQRSLIDATHELYHPVGVQAMIRFLNITDVSRWRRPASFSTPAPSFLVGFPRSGTTLLDQVLSSHPAVRCLEEKEYFATALGQVFRRPDQLAGMGSLSDYEIHAVRVAYWRQVGKLSGETVVDKLPLNIVVLPLIRAVFPDARIILAIRDPRDVILSCFQQRFAANVAMAQLLGLETAADYYASVMTLLELGRARLGLPFHTVRYEDVVADLEGQARALAAFLDLPFDAAMLDYRRTALERDINTPSARQVIQPLYTRSIGRWRRYAEQLAPVLPVLNAWAIRYGYSAA